MAQVGATEFKARCLELMDRVAERRETYVITKRGRPVAKLVPADPPEEKRSAFGCMAGEMQIVGDLARPPWSDEEWREIERQREEQWRSWDREWQLTGRISGRGPEAAASRPGPRAARGRKRS